MAKREKGLLDYISDWFKILLRSGIPALLIGLGWVSTFLGSIWLGSSWAEGPAFYVCAGTGIMMILLGYRVHNKELDNRPSPES